MIFVILSGFGNITQYIKLHDLFYLVQSVLKYLPPYTTTLRSYFHLSYNFDLLKLPEKNKKQSQVGTKLRCCLLLAVYSPYGDTNFFDLEVHGIFAILIRSIFRTLFAKMFNG